jgi:hypothetical protein
MDTKDSEFEIFAQSVHHDFAPALIGMNFHQEHIDSRLFVFSRKDLSIKIYLPECHGYDITVTLSPIHTKTHHDKSERQLYWLGEFLKIGKFVTSRRTYPNQIPELVKLNAEFLRKVIDEMDLGKPSIWQGLDSFIHNSVDKEFTK